MSIFLYNPDKKDKTAFLDEFVVRTRIFDHLFWEISTDKMIVPEQHYMIVGQRGAGKTSMLLRLKYAVEDDQVLSKRVIPVMFGDEQYSIGELGNLWERIAAYLEENHGFEGIMGEIEPHIHERDYEEATFNILIKYLDQRKQDRIMLLIDNIGRLFDKFEINEIRRLRQVLQTWPHIRLVAASPVIVHYIVDYDQPLHEFFKIIRLNSLTDEEAMTLIRKLASIHHEEKKIEQILTTSPERVTTLNTLSDGIPRAIVLLFREFLDNEHGDVLSDLERVLDAVTPLYKHTMDKLPPQQQKIIDAMALHWEPMEVKDLTKTVRLESKVISAQLRQLEKSQLVLRSRTKTKNHLYQLEERFFNIWYVMRYGKSIHRDKVIWLMKFLVAWVDKEGLAESVREDVKEEKRGKLNDGTFKIYELTYSFFERIKIETGPLVEENGSAYFSSGMKVNDQDLLNAFEKEAEKGNLRKAIKTIIDVDFEKPENRDRMLKYLLENDSRLLVLADQLNNAPSHKGVRSSYFYRAVAFTLAYFSVKRAVIQHAEKDATRIMSNLLAFIDSNYQEKGISPREQAMLLMLMTFLFSAEYHNAIWKVLLYFDDKKMPLVFNLVRYYLATNMNEEVAASRLSTQLLSVLSPEHMNRFITGIQEMKSILKE
ncbi:hypothetical protein [Chitinophaga qingshengii]|uniref:AAA+ ATPase domain-containing protein n=1 Tax=Chitinophaga qingshengii TaxID=1569794 RepID=A0ABR7TJJ2_9BACT|nr:hypothetical protein [Chitinophaga qingshengii]MBC9930653.1 hypothetical protein [Chitinophaga qingshengii]